MLHGVPKALTYEDILEALEDRFRDQRFAAFSRSQQNTRTQEVWESLQEFATAFEQLAHCFYPALPEDHIRRGWQSVGILGKRLCHKNPTAAGRENGAVRQALELQAVLLATRPHKTSTRTF
jgi:hypothetical protein